jgi:hypothetical protein
VDKSNVAVNTTPEEDDQEVDEFTSSRGFEFIDGDNDSRGRVLDLDDDSSGELFPSANDCYMPIPVNFISALFARTIGALVTIKLMPSFHDS